MQPSIRSRRADAAEPAGAPPLPLLVPIAVVIAAGCEPCAESMVRRALALGAPVPLVRQTLAVVAAVRAQACFVGAVGPDVARRLDGSLRAALHALPAARSLRTPAGVGRGV